MGVKNANWSAGNQIKMKRQNALYVALYCWDDGLPNKTR